ncbi:PQQ-binding-like beta-propeller repeat protein [Dyadobacter sp. LHD-138]|uniref:outer membrane protein assembly factor BamB family protein n=1 Tax=Dyadobacter sp. LHD-138 TaxID=3071413 RepID=UPI0027E15BD0|nr:PQQ-binding-like beta-propeller repeat protein [Dyadobacter sp. LHD-138]MDQ6478282.1 PQQ-binding-like beta-propeller repeat protein [Dyadobacter sp. LHD-138]
MKKILIPGLFLLTVSLISAKLTSSDKKKNADVDWPEYLGGSDRNHYSILTQINTTNVTKLTKAWEYHSLDSGQVQCNPIIVNGTLYGVTATNQVFALDAATGKEKWKFKAGKGGGLNTNRGVTYWSSGNESRIMYAYESWLYALDAVSGQPIKSFGADGRVSLKKGLGAAAQDKFVISNTPGTLYGDLIYMPLRLSEGPDAAPGNIQAFNVRTGELAWAFHTIPHPGEFGYNTWPKEVYKNTEVGAANNWAGMAVDKKRGILYVPTGSAGFDFYGGNRAGQNLFANSLVALNAKTGKRIWHFQFVHHDLWDRDIPAPPNLVTIKKDNKIIDVVAQVTKLGYVYVFDRVTGAPIFPIKEVPVPKSNVAGEKSWPTQPVPTLPLPYARQTVTEADINPHSENRDSLLAIYRKVKKGLYQPFGEIPTLLLPGFDGGAEWGGAAVDPDGIMYVNANEMPWIASLSPTPKEDELSHLSPGQRVYTLNCLVCHGPERKGNPKSGYPSLLDIGQRKDREFVSKLITSGKGMMPGFTSITGEEKQALVSFLFGDEKVEVATNSKGKKAPVMPYKFNGYNKFLDSKGYPAISPPWGTLTAIDLNTGKHLWQNTLGEFKELTAKGIAPTGTENYGGPVITAGGILFIAATKDGMFRAFDKKTGKLLWQTELPAAGFATPSTYEVNGKQYVVVACGGTKLGTKKGDSYVAFALP